MHTCALDTTGKAWCWGNDGDGQVGDGDVDPRGHKYDPAPVAGDRTYITITAGYVHTCAVDTTGKAWCWGWDETGQVGDGDGHLDRYGPVPVTGDRTYTTITAGNMHTCAADTTGKAWCWGHDFSGQVGDGDIDQSNKYAPVAVTGGHTFTQP